MMHIFIFLFSLNIYLFGLLFFTNFYFVLLFVAIFIFLFYFKSLKKKIKKNKGKFFKKLFKSEKFKKSKKKIEYWMSCFYFSVVSTQLFFRFILALLEMLYKYIISQSLAFSLMGGWPPINTSSSFDDFDKTKEADEFLLSLVNEHSQADDNLHAGVLHFQKTGDILFEDFFCNASQEVVSGANYAMNTCYKNKMFPISAGQIKAGPDIVTTTDVVVPVQLKNYIALSEFRMKDMIKKYPEDVHIDILCRRFKENQQQAIENMINEENARKKRQISLRFLSNNAMSIEQVQIVRKNHMMNRAHYLEMKKLSERHLMDYSAVVKVVKKCKNIKI